MNANIKDTTIHVNLMKLVLALEMNPAMGSLMRPSSLERVQAMDGLPTANSLCITQYTY